MDFNGDRFFVTTVGVTEQTGGESIAGVGGRKRGLKQRNEKES